MNKTVNKLIFWIICIVIMIFSGCSKDIKIVEKDMPIDNKTIDENNKEIKEADTVLKDFKLIKDEASMSKEKYKDCIFNESSIKLLSHTDIIGYDKVLLQIGINEIYARHGYIFSKAEWQKYFSKKEWYKENEEFTATNLNEIERQNIKFLKESECVKIKGDLSFDIDLDGEKEILDLSLEKIIEIADYTYVDEKYPDSYYGALITDIDINDEQLEVLIFDGGPSGDDTIGLYRYGDKNSKLKYIKASTARWYDYSIVGNEYFKMEGYRHGIYVVNTYKLTDPEYIDTEYHEYTISKDIGKIPKGTKVTIQGFDYEDDQEYKGIEGVDHGPNGLLGIKIAPVENENTMEIIDLSSYDTIIGSNEDTKEVIPLELLIEIFDEINHMYYGD